MLDKTIRTVIPADISPLLTEITDPPETLRIQGTYPGHDQGVEKYLTVVGSRKYSDYGKAACESLILGLVGYPIAIISGLALGMDVIAHKAALDAGLKTIAVPGSGLAEDVLYPASHRGLRDTILEAGGCLLSEFDDDFRATPYAFPQRNRIMAGLSHAVFVVEAVPKSGTLITSKYATDYNRDVFTIPHTIFTPTGAGPHRLIREGATPIRSADDILEAFGLTKHEGLFANQSSKSKRSYRDCSPDELHIISLLDEPKTRDELFIYIDKPIHTIQATLSMLELRGYIEEKLGKIRLT